MGLRSLAHWSDLGTTPRGGREGRSIPSDRSGSAPARGKNPEPDVRVGGMTDLPPLPGERDDWRRDGTGGNLTEVVEISYDTRHLEWLGPRSLGRRVEATRVER